MLRICTYAAAFGGRVVTERYSVLTMAGPEGVAMLSKSPAGRELHVSQAVGPVTLRVGQRPDVGYKKGGQAVAVAQCRFCMIGLRNVNADARPSPRSQTLGGLP